MTKEKYTCPRCGFTSNKKYNMKTHLYDLKKVCPGIKNTLTLTDEIKQHILDNRIYVITKPLQPQKIINNNINNYQQINNLITNMDPLEKINKYMKYKNIQLVDIEETLNDTFLETTEKLKNNKFKNFHLNVQSIIEIIDEVTTINDINKLNIFYDNILNKIKIFCESEWTSLLIDVGIKNIVDKIQYAYLNSYECYIIRKMIIEPNTQSKMALRELLVEYYKFLAWFDIEPYIHKRNNNKILFNDNDDKYYERDNDFSIYDNHYHIYTNILSKINKTEQNKVKKGIENIIKKNTKSFIIELNKKMLQSFKNDEEFKNEVVNNILQLT
jgi:hypothetical protein